VLFAACFDLSQAFLEWILIGIVINPILDIGVGFLFHRIFKSKGVNFKGTIALVFFGLAFLEFVPVVAEFPLWTIDIIAVIIMTKAEDRLSSKVGSSKAGKMMRNPARIRRIGRVALNNINRASLSKNATDKNAGESSERQNDPDTDQNENYSSPEKMRWQSQNKKDNNPQSQRLGSGSKENIKKNDSNDKRSEILKQQREAKQNRIAKSNNEEYGNKDKKNNTSNQDYNKQKTFRFDNDFGRQNDSSRPQSERDIINIQRQAKSNRPKNNASEEFKKAA
jgi:hypothetical protein